MRSSKLSLVAVILLLVSTGCSSCEDVFFERPDYALCSHSQGSVWESNPDEFTQFKRKLPTQTNGCLVYNSDLEFTITAVTVKGMICNACDSKIELPVANFRGLPIIQSTLRIDDNDYATCLNAGGEPAALDVIPSVQAIESGESIPASGNFLYRGGFTDLSIRSLSRGNELQLFWPSLSSEEVLLERLETQCFGRFELNDSLFVQVVDEPFSAPVRNFLEDRILRRD